MITVYFTDVDKQEAYVGSEPVTLAEVKSHLRVDFTDDDVLLAALITACREAIEDYCHITLVPKTITLTLKATDNIKSIYAQPWQVREAFNEFEIPYGPIKSVTSVTSIDSNGTTIINLALNSDYYLSGVSFLTAKIMNNFTNNIMVYQAGYPGAIPRSLWLAILNEIAYRYELRGDGQNVRATAFTQQGVCEAARVIADKYRRMAWI